MKRLLKLALFLFVVYLIIRLLKEYFQPKRVSLEEQVSPSPPHPTPKPPPSPAAEPPSAPPEEPARLNLNLADATALIALPGIGPALAKRIIAHRQQSGLFDALDDLTEVQGIGPALVKRLRPLVDVLK